MEKFPLSDDEFIRKIQVIGTDVLNLLEKRQDTGDYAVLALGQCIVFILDHFIEPVEKKEIANRVMSMIAHTIKEDTKPL